MFNFIGENNSNELGNTCKNQISVQRLFILGSASCKTQIILDVINISFNNRPDFVGVIPSFGSADDTGISTKLLFRIDIDHAPARGRSTRIFTAAKSVIFSSCIMLFPFNLRANEFVSCYPTAKFGSSFALQWQRRIMGTTGNTIFINGIIPTFKSGFCIQRNIRLDEMSVITKSVTSKKLFVEFCSIKSRITKEFFGINQRMF